MEALSVDQLSDGFLRSMNEELAKALDGHCVFINCPMYPPLDDEFRVVMEELTQINPAKKSDHLIVVLQTSGGLMETVERLVSSMRHHYKRVSFIVPNYAYSAGTVLVMSGDNIYMDYYSVLGPIDPQVKTQDGKWLPGIGYLSKFNQLTEQINASAGEEDKNVKAELAYLVKNFDPAELFRIEQAVAHGVTLITQWLSTFKFKDWKQTKTNKTRVTKSIREKRAEEIARVLGDAQKWHSHGRGISMRELKGDDIKLVIEDFGSLPELSIKVRNYHGLAVDYYEQKLGVKGFIHSRGGLRRVL